MIPGDQVKATHIVPLLNDGSQAPTPRELEIWRQSRLEALEWLELPDAWGDLSLIDKLEARQATIRTEQVRHREAAREAVRRALALSPSNSFLWLRLATLEALLSAPPAGVLAAVNNSIATAPYEPGALYGRIALVFYLWDDTDLTLRTTIEEQIAMLVPAARWRDITRLARLFPEHAELLRGQLAASELAKQALDQGLSPEA